MLKARVQVATRPDDPSLDMAVQFTALHADGKTAVGSFTVTGPQNGVLGKLGLGSTVQFVIDGADAILGTAQSAVAAATDAAASTG